MALNPHIVRIVVSQIADEEKRERLVIAIIIGITIVLLIFLIPMFAILSSSDDIKGYFSFEDDGTTIDESYYSLIEMHNKYANIVNVGELECNGIFPMPVQSAVITSEFVTRIDPISGKRSFHTGMDLAGKWHSNITAVEKGTIVFAGVQRGYGNCVEIKHKTNSETIYYTFYAHLARVDVKEGQEVERGTVVGIQGGDPKRDPNPGYSTGSHLHFEIRMSKNGDFINPKEYLYGKKEI